MTQPTTLDLLLRLANALAEGMALVAEARAIIEDDEPTTAPVCSYCGQPMPGKRRDARVCDGPECRRQKRVEARP